MNWLWKWLLAPPIFYTGGGQGGGSGDNQAAEEARKSALRRQIDSFYGYSDAAPATPKPGEDGWFANVRSQLANGPPPPDTTDQTAADARTAMDAENTQLGGATRSYYTDQLKRQYDIAERNQRFQLARQGLLGGSPESDTQAEISSARDLGATRVDDAVTQAITGLKTQREQERLNAINLVNAGGGESAVSAAQAGLRNAFASRASASKADLFGDLFATSAQGIADARTNQANLAFLNNLRNSPGLSSFFAQPASGGRVTG